jgi:cell division protein FtsB
MTEEELRAICKGCRERYPNWDCWGCPNYADVELVQHEQSQADLISKLEAELEQVKRERDAAVECIERIIKTISYAYVKEMVDYIDKRCRVKERS